MKIKMSMLLKRKNEKVMKILPVLLLIMFIVFQARIVYAAPLASSTLVKSLYGLIEQGLLVIFAFFLFSHSRTFRNVFHFQATVWNILLTIILFILMGIYGSMMGIRVFDAISNVRDTAPLIAGFIGGPVIGIISGFLIALHRFLMGGFTKIPCALATLLAGTVAGLLSKPFKKSISYWMAIIVTIGIELLHMIFILIISKPYSKSLLLVKQIIIPMVAVNTINIFIFVFILRNIVNKKLS